VRLLHGLAKIHATFDDPDLVSRAGLVPVMALAQRAGLADLVAEHVRIGHRCGVNAHLKVPCLAAGMIAGADSIDDMDLLRHGAMPVLFGGIRAPSTLGSFLRAFTWGNVLQLEQVSRLLLADLARRTPLLPGKDTVAFPDIDSMQKRVYGHHKHGAAFGHTKIQGKSLLVRGLNVLAATISTPVAAPVIAATRLRRQRRLLPWCRQLRHGIGCHRPRHRVHRDPDRAGGLGVLLRGVHRLGAPGRGLLLRYGTHEPRGEGGDRRHRRSSLDAGPLPAGDLG
jgi:hypothetical protein